MKGHGTLEWRELLASDPTAVKDFFSAVVGWHYKEVPGMGSDESHWVSTYWMAMPADAKQPTAGIMESPKGADGKQAADNWINYIKVADVDKSVTAAKANGGKVYREASDIPNVGRIAVVAAPGGSAIGLITPSES